MRAATTSPTYVKQRLWLPSPYTVMGWPSRACFTKFGMTIP
jgi:hypothetical protein